FRNPYDNTLFIQCITLVITNFVLLHYCYLYSSGGKSQKIYSNKIKPIVRIAIVFCFIQILTIIMILMLELNSPYIQVFGYFSSIIEASITLPQLYYNYIKKNTKGLSITTISMWLFGDAFKFFYLVNAHAPYPFILCNLFQTVVDVVIAFQSRISRLDTIWYYSRKCLSGSYSGPQFSTRSMRNKCINIPCI
ncbi:hypothetical protein HZS_722, partial [Henneguya salminicola]